MPNPSDSESIRASERSLFASGPGPETVVDLTHPLDADAPFWPGDLGFTLRNDFDGATNDGQDSFSNSFSMGEHVGTHIDAPRHMNREGRTVDRIPLDRLIGPGVRVDVSARIADLKDRDACVSLEDLADWERRNGPIPEGSIVLLRTGHSRHWGNRRFYLGTDGIGESDSHDLHFPGLAPEAARWLTEERRIRAVGIDTAGIDPGNSTEFPTHRILFAREIPAMENLANLEGLPDRGFVVVALPIKIRGGSGGPLRIVAILDTRSAARPGRSYASSEVSSPQ